MKGAGFSPLAVVLVCVADILIVYKNKGWERKASFLRRRDVVVDRALNGVVRGLGLTRLQS